MAAPASLDAFYIGAYPVTNFQYGEFVTTTGHRLPDCWEDCNLNTPPHPVVVVNWFDAEEYCNWAGNRLTTEAEWEKVARGGLVGKQYPWGDETQCNFADTSVPRDWRQPDINDGYAFTSPVGNYPPNRYGLLRYGLFDMAGNVWEWLSDDRRVCTTSAQVNPKGPFSAKTRAVRGGDWAGPIYHMRCSRRGAAPMEVPSGHSWNMGIRCVRSAQSA